ncbi:DUF4378 domain-containing protein [Cephalotus follicularis]|uniref:DUF4378 domain-containing protein n=1 Tax=Cephalotus follicularis TaxID=3775 RepID=A0A1Q3BNI9_CEPFO|nr:DUF4378 domain-containing protein [Cephalotus follicularis]
MGKNRRNKSSATGIAIENYHPGCVWKWNLLHLLKYNHWYHVKKRLPHNRRAGGGHATGNEKLQAQNEGGMGNIVDGKMMMTQPTPATKNSVTTRIKALISEEIYRLKGHHHRSSSCPVRSHLSRTDSIHHLEPSNDDQLFGLTLDDLSANFVDQNNVSSYATFLPDTMVPNFYEEPVNTDKICEEYRALLTSDDLGFNQVNVNGEQRIDDDMLSMEKLDDTKHSLSQKRLILAMEPTTDASLQQSKELLDAPDLILYDSGSLLSNHFLSKPEFHAGMGLTKSGSFPLPGSADRRDPGPSKLMQKSVSKQPGPSIAAAYRADGLKLNQAMAEIVDNCSSGSSKHLKDHHGNKIVIKRFKDLKQKIRHAIKESKKERHRITMDGILHKVPHSQLFSKDLKKDIKNRLKESAMKREGGRGSPRNSYESDHSVCSIFKNEGCHKRTPSLDESLDRYCQSYDSSFKRQAKNHLEEKSKLRTEEAALPTKTALKTLGRIFSSPELRSYEYSCEDSPEPRTVVDDIVSKRSKFDKQKGTDTDLDIGSECYSNLDAPVKSEIQESFVDIGEVYSIIEQQVGSTSVDSDADAKENVIVDDLGNWVTGDNVPSIEHDISPPTCELVEPKDTNYQGVTTNTAEISTSEETDIGYIETDADVKLKHIPSGGLDSLANQQQESDMDTPRASENGEETLSKHQGSNILHLQLNAKDKLKFNYVRDVLKLSGFSGNEPLGTWHSNEQPVDPRVYEEVEDCILLGPNSHKNEEGGNCDDLVLFDIINEVLIEIYENAYTYYPKPLSSLSHIRPMPLGYHVLEEVWAQITWYLSSTPEADQSLDYVVTRDLSKNDGWMNLQFDSECVGLQLEDMIFYDLLAEVCGLELSC